ncbi:class I adenylate-forming enzyme family protein [Candidatus Methylobacter oryzae]|uniref:Acyl--CoA ligase n=1 Tax=Candidatus Methylobacter oryzae TaxID=2497749 RepID=A0ABY3CAY1_9GAMM|nr:class I adenylate-forming enzyme family protein [Candidatus Methylobacter oryzae]TRW92069.1 acyl--CoA ligase [Candidatus Methylobacter oryzae]
MSRLLQDSLLTTAACHPDDTALIAGDVRASYREVMDYACRLAHALRSRGVSRGDRVAIFMDNTWQCALSIYGVLLAGGVFVIVNAQTKQDKLAFILRDSGSQALLSEANLSRVFAPLIEQLPAVKILSTATSKTLPAGVENIDEILADMPAALPPQSAITLDLAALIYTSGSTGEPKGVMHTHQSMLFALKSLVEYLRLEKTDRLLCVLPLAFDYGLYQWLMAVYTGATLVLERSFTYPAQVLSVVETEGVTVFPGVPTIFAMLLAAHERQALSFPKVRRVTNTAASLPANFNTRLREVFPNADIYRMYGLTECKRVSYLPPEQIEQKPESVGIAIPGTEVMVLDDAGQPVKPGEVGTLYVRGPHVMLGYWNQPEKTAHMLKPGALPGELMLCTHDLFSVDEDGYLYFVGRTDDIIKSRGEKISPLEIEAVLYAIPGIREAVVLGIPDILLGQAVMAFVSVMENSTLTEGRIKKLCCDKLESFMVPKYVTILPELPRSANNKTDKKALAAML